MPGWDEWSCFPFSLNSNLAVQLQRFWSIGYYYLSQLNCTKPHWTSCHPTLVYWFHFGSEFFLLFLAFHFFSSFSCLFIYHSSQISRSIILESFVLFTALHFIPIQPLGCSHSISKFSFFFFNGIWSHLLSRLFVTFCPLISRFQWGSIRQLWSICLHFMSS